MLLNVKCMPVCMRLSVFKCSLLVSLSEWLCVCLWKCPCSCAVCWKLNRTLNNDLLINFAAMRICSFIMFVKKEIVIDVRSVALHLHLLPLARGLSLSLSLSTSQRNRKLWWWKNVVSLFFGGQKSKNAEKEWNNSSREKCGCMLLWYDLIYRYMVFYYFGTCLFISLLYAERSEWIKKPHVVRYRLCVPSKCCIFVSAWSKKKKAKIKINKIQRQFRFIFIHFII